MKKFLILSLALMAIVTMVLTGCRQEDPPVSDLVVIYGKIYTAEIDSSKEVSDKDHYIMAEAMVIKDDKYLYVGSEEGAEQYVTNGVYIIDWRGKGMIMPSCANGHAHYIVGFGLKSFGFTIDSEDDVPTFLNKVKTEADRARSLGKVVVYAQGWNYHIFKDNMPTRYDLDKICSDIPMFFADDEGHKGLANTLCLQNAGILDKDGKPLMKEDGIRGGEIVMNNGDPTGLLKEQAGTYVRYQLENDKLYTVDMAKQNLKEIERYLHSVGYTMYMDGWSNYYNNTNAYQAATQLDNSKDLHIILGMSYEIESWNNLFEAIKAAKEAKSYTSKHVYPNWVKLFMDGTVEGGTGYCVKLYPDGHQGIKNWEKEEIANITRESNANGMSMHIHTMGDAAVRDVVDAFIDGGQKDKRNTIVHVRNVPEGYYQKMADNNIYATVGMLWHHFHYLAPTVLWLEGMVPEGMESQSYPMRSYFEYGVNMCSHSDFPALSLSPDDPFGIMEIAVTGVWYKDCERLWGEGWWIEELLTRRQALQALTINGAKQLFLENERGSIKVGKYADFLLIDQDVLTCDAGELRNTRVMKTFFEGREVYGR